MQNIHITGRLTDNAELKKVVVQGKEREFVSFTAAVNEKYNNVEETTFYECTMSKTGIFDYLKKGQTVAINGPFRFRKQDGVNKKGEPTVFTHLNIRVAQIELIGGNKPAQAPEAVSEMEDIPESN